MKIDFFSLVRRFCVFAIFVLSIGFFGAHSNFFIHQVSAADYVQEVLYPYYQGNQELCGKLCNALFSPDDDIESVLIGLIDAEQEAIYTAQYLISNKAIAQALIAAHERGVLVEVVTDKFCTRSPFGKAKMLAESGIKVFEYDPHEKMKKFFKKDSIMHHKFFIFKKSIDDKSVLATGSYNCTLAAAHDNQENCVFIEDSSLIATFAYQFKRLKKRSRIFK